MTNTTKPTRGDRQEHPQQYIIERCLYCIFNNFKVLHKENNSIVRKLEVEHKTGDLIIHFGTEYYIATGSVEQTLRVWHKEQLVFEASGQAIKQIPDLRLITYIYGDWEKKIPAQFTN